MERNELKGILKDPNRLSINRFKKTATFDELNVLETLHPLNKCYGVTKSDEPKMPFKFEVPDSSDPSTFDINDLNEKLRRAANTQTPSFGDENLSDDEFPETDEEKIHRLEFERRRKAHDKEYDVVKIARKLIEEELNATDDYDYDEDNDISIEDSNIEVSNSVELEHQIEKSSEEKGICLDEQSIQSVNVPTMLPCPKPPENEPYLTPGHPCYGKLKLQKKEDSP